VGLEAGFMVVPLLFAILAGLLAVERVWKMDTSARTT
jgi:hypothetical protein